MKAIYIEWEDHCQVFKNDGGAWIELEDIQNQPAVIRSVGLAVKEDDKYLTIATCKDEEDTSFKGVSVVIKSCILKRKDFDVD